MHGNGTMNWADGRKYTGPWKNDLQQGLGIFYNPKTGQKLQGEWKEGKRIRWMSNPIKVQGENNRALTTSSGKRPLTYGGLRK